MVSIRNLFQVDHSALIKMMVTLFHLLSVLHFWCCLYFYFIIILIISQLLWGLWLGKGCPNTQTKKEYLHRLIYHVGLAVQVMLGERITITLHSVWPPEIKPRFMFICYIRWENTLSGCAICTWHHVYPNALKAIEMVL